MKKFSHRIISIFVAIVMLISLSVCAFAEDTVVYTCLGDSNASGYGLEGYVFSRIDVDTAYHSLVANGANAELRNFGGGGYRSHEIRYLLDPEYVMDWTYSEFCMGAVKKEQMDVYKADYVQAVVDADYISIEVGPNEIMGDAMHYSLEVYNSPVKEIEDLKAIFATLGMDESINETLDAFAKAISAVRFLADFLPRVKTCCEEFRENWDAIIENIYELNPDVEIIALSAINPMNNTTLNVGDTLKVGKIFDLIFGRYNYWIEYGSEYADTYTYCDISDMPLGEMAFTQPDFWEINLKQGHHNAADHAEIADRIVAIIESKEAAKA